MGTGQHTTSTQPRSAIDRILARRVNAPRMAEAWFIAARQGRASAPNRLAARFQMSMAMKCPTCGVAELTHYARSRISRVRSAVTYWVSANEAEKVNAHKDLQMETSGQPGNLGFTQSGHWYHALDRVQAQTT